MLCNVIKRFCSMKPLTDFAISKESLSKLKSLGITELFPIQANTFQAIRDGKDVVAQARTGSGKTIAFALPLVEKLQEVHLERLEKRGRKPLVLTLAPTRELANQTATVFSNLISYGGFSVLPVYGGTPYMKQEMALSNGVDILVGAPGRIIDLVERGKLHLDSVQHVILDEVDRMLDMGFLPDVDFILKEIYGNAGQDDDDRPQTMLFSATLPPWIEKTSKRFLSKNNIERHYLPEDELTPTCIEHYAMECPRYVRPRILKDLISLNCQSDDERCIIFCQRKKEADELASDPLMPPNCHVLHGDIPQIKREMVLKRFREGKYKILVTTDVAARGLDIPEVKLVIMCTPPEDIDFYIHRSGRTGRAGREGKCICLYQRSNAALLDKIEWAAGITFKRMKPPSNRQIMEVAISSTTQKLQSVSDKNITKFTKPAQELIETMGPEKAVAAALACLSNAVEADEDNVSLISNRPGHTAMIFKYDRPFVPNKGFLYKVLERTVSDLESAISFVQFVKNESAMIFDIANQALPDLEKHWNDDERTTISRLEEMPEVDETRNISKVDNEYGRGPSQRGTTPWRGSRGGYGSVRGRRDTYSRGSGYKRGSNRFNYDFDDDHSWDEKPTKSRRQEW